MTSALHPEAKKYRIQKYRIDVVREHYPDKYRVMVANQRDVGEFCKKFLADMPFEYVVIVAMDNGDRIIGFQAVEGATNQCALYPQNTFLFLLSAGAASFILAHNHPGGSKTPSGADWDIVTKLFNAGKLLNVTMHDSLIISDEDTVSMREMSRWPS
jgi:DNA repair protein RadC